MMFATYVAVLLSRRIVGVCQQDMLTDFTTVSCNFLGLDLWVYSSTSKT